MWEAVLYPIYRLAEMYIHIQNTKYKMQNTKYKRKKIQNILY